MVSVLKTTRGQTVKANKSKRGAGKQAETINWQAGRAEKGQKHYSGTTEDLVYDNGVDEVQVRPDVAIRSRCAGGCGNHPL